LPEVKEAQRLARNWKPSYR